MSWGPWIEHDHSGIPVPVGTIVHRVFEMPVNFMFGEAVKNPTDEHISRIEPNEFLSWFGGGSFGRHKIPAIIRYRVRKPAGLTALERIAANPEPIAREHEGEPA